MEQVLFEGWPPLARTLTMGVLAYAVLVAIIRMAGKRVLSKWNAFDFIVTVALGSALASALLNEDVSLAQGAVGFAVLVLLQFLVTWLAVRFRSLERLVKAQPTLLLYRGRFHDEAMRRERVTRSELLATVRASGIANVEAVGAVILETDGSFSVIRSVDVPATALEDVAGYQRALSETPGN
jgi:uncharacterized membrane protein YcaP (DUF421 family)